MAEEPEPIAPETPTPRVITVPLEEQENPRGVLLRTPKSRNRVELERDDERQWTPPPTARELTAADPFYGCGGPVGWSGHRRWIKSAETGPRWPRRKATKATEDV